MAAGIYNTDLTVINLCESITGFGALGSGGAGLAVGADFSIQGTNAVDKGISNGLKGIIYDNGSTITLGADEHILIWEICATPGITSIQSLGGVRISIGTATNAYYEWYVNGSDTLPEGGIINYAIYYDGSTANNQVGSPGANPQVFGGQANVTTSAKGVNFGLDAMRYGTGFYLTAGDATEPINFDSASLVNDSNTNRYGILSSAIGGYALKGRFVVGQDNTFTPTQAYFDASNTNISFTDTPFTKTDFTQIIVDHPSTFFQISSINFTGTGTNNPGQIVFNDSSTTGYILGCNFNTIGKVFLQANVSATGSSFNSTDTVFQSGSNLFDSTFRTTTGVSSSILVTDPSKLSFNTLDNEGSKHGIEVTSTGSYVFEANIFSNFDSGSNANEALYFNPTGGTGNLTLQIVGGGTTVDFRNASSGTVTIENNASITVTGLQDNTEVRIFDSATTGPQTELAGIEDAIDGTSGNRSFTFTLPVGTIVDIVLISVQYENDRLDDFEITISQDLPFEQTFDRNYSNPEQGEIASLFNSLQSRSTYFENQSESEVFPTFLEDNNLLNSASLLYVASGYSSGSIQSLIPSSSDGDMLIVDRGIASRPAYPQYLSRINNEGYVITGSTGGLVPLNYSSTDLGKSGSFCLVPDFISSNSSVNKWVDGSIFRNNATTFSTGSNTVFTQSVAGISTPQGPVQGENNAARLTDDNSGGSKEVFFTQTLSVTDTSKYQYTTFASSSGANWLYMSASFQSGSCVGWFDITNGVTGSTTDNGLLDGIFDVQSFPNNWKRVGLQFEPFGLGSGNFTLGIADADNTKTVTADGDASMILWGNNTPRPNNSSLSNSRMIPFYYSSNTTAIPDYALSSSLSGGALTEGTFYVEGSFNYTPLASGSGTNVDFAISLVNSTLETEYFSIEFNYSSTIGSFITCRSVTSAGNSSTQFSSALIPSEYFNDNKMAKVAIRIKDGDYRVSCNGSDSIFTPSELPPLDKLVVNRSADSSGRFKTIAVFDKAFTNTELNNLTS